MWFWPLETLQYPTSSKKYRQCCFHFIFKKTATLMENMDRTQNVNSHNKINESTKVKIVHKKYFNICEIVGYIVWIITIRLQITLRHKMCFTLPYKYCSKQFLPWYTYSNTLLINKTDLNKKCYGSTIFHEILQYQNFMKPCPVVLQLLHEHRQAAKQTGEKAEQQAEEQF